MNYPFLGYNMPGLQLGQQGGLSGANPSIPYDTGNLGFAGNYNALGSNPSYQSLGTSMGGISAQPNNWMSNTSNWMTNNADLLKAGVGAITGGIGAWQGMQQNKLMRDNMNMQSNQFREQMDLSKQNINRNIEDRQRARVASNPQAYESVDSYMKKYGVK